MTTRRTVNRDVHERALAELASVRSAIEWAIKQAYEQGQKAVRAELIAELGYDTDENLPPDIPGIIAAWRQDAEQEIVSGYFNRQADCGFGA